jgi:signal transduction histidine kinase
VSTPFTTPGVDLPHERVEELLAAVLVVGEDLDLPRVLERIVAAACRLVDARYGALGVLAADDGSRTEGSSGDRRSERRLSQFVTVGVTPGQREAIGDPPLGRGVLGLLIDDARPLRLADLAEHPASTGFPPNHPPMGSFLGVPVRAGGRVYGNLYLTEKVGSAEFTEADEQVVVALAAAAGAAVANAWLYAESERRRRWVEASAEITSTILGRVDRRAALQLVATRAREVTEADLAAVVVEDDDGRLVVEASAAFDGAPPVGTILSGTGPLAEVLAAGEARAVAGLGDPGGLGEGSALLVPVAGPQGRDMLLVVSAHQHGQRAFGSADLEPVRSFAAQAVLALDRAQAEEDRAALAVLEDRDRIARDLHDLVIQRLFATGLQLQGAIRLTGKPQVRERIEAAVDDLDATIRDIRASIFALHRRPGDGDLRGLLADLVADSSHGLGYVPALSVEGPVEHAVPEEVRSHLLAVLQEALSNAARHAQATRVDVRVAVAEGWVVATVRDDGTGIPATRRESGLTNLRRRAKECGGSFEVATAEGGGTLLTWRAPLTQ